ncbi:ZIP family metal transporter [Candidatus Synchoanobacter obligatus]|uniref:ZIP family metal transporter n=1 Tax=Candidatus Synchoanobacter obligatus TaxID=2919597 RepID=A0ABT1L7S6_9GAMM|nr:ZIP family metal transporter [Candidatus Synchoanobacter obligatus]MCP8352605.1 ZIP family metal transporter [Candidatus Synchoanobacter obligatus]
MSSVLLTTSIIAFFASLFGGIIPLKKNNIGHHRWAHHLDSFCDGMFIAIACTHLLPEIYEHSATTLQFTFYALAILATVLAIQLPIKSNHSNMKHYITYILFAHCLVEGITVAAVSDPTLQHTLSMAILAHKTVEAFVFFNLISRQNWSQNTLYLLLIVFSLLTPFGIFIGSYLTLLPENIYLFIQSLTCGSFLGISINCFLLHSCDDHQHIKFLWVLLGGLTFVMLIPQGCCH